MPSDATTIGYAIIAMVESAVTPITAKLVSRSLFAWRGSTAAMASAAEAPQIATAPPVSTPKRASSAQTRASAMPSAIVTSTESAIRPAVA